MELLERGLALTALLGDREELVNEERKGMRELGLRVSGPRQMAAVSQRPAGILALVRQLRRSPLLDHCTGKH